MDNYEHYAKEIAKVDRRAKLEQLAEESAELGKACLKLIRATGNGNPCNVTEEEATKKVIEEYSDVAVAAEYLMSELQAECDYDVYELFHDIASKKIRRWSERLEAEHDGQQSQ